jgi:peroxiredoxin
MYGTHYTLLMHALVLLAFLQAPALTEPMRAGCSPDDPVIATVSAKDQVEVQTARAGESDKTCYKIVLSRSGEPSTGYVLGEALPAVSTFVHGREKESIEAAEAQARYVPPASGHAKEDCIKPLDPNLPSHFDDFSGRDSRGKPFSLSGLRGRAVVVTFWSPKNRASISQLASMMPLYNQLHNSGLAAVGVSMDPKTSRITDALDDITLPWPQVADQSGLAAHYRVDPKAGETFVLDVSHRVVAAGPMGPEIEKAVRQLLAAPDGRVISCRFE